MNVDKKPKVLARIQVGIMIALANAMYILITMLGVGRCRTVPTHQSLGQPLRSSTSANSSDTSDKE